MADFSPLATQEIGGISVGTVGGETVTEYGTGNIVTDTGITTSLGTPATTDNFPPQTDWEQEPDPVVTLPKRYGAHKSVIDKLSQISFVSGCTGGEMSDAIAYIRYWSRSGVSQKNPVQLSQQFTLPDSKSQELSTTLSNLYGSDIDFNSTQYSLPENYRPADAFKGTPLNSLYGSQYDFTTPEFNPTVAVSEQTQSGSVYAANPSGSTESSSAPANDAVWQFLFNPEELQLSSGPEYNRAESWGVSDEKNNGQPLSWRMNRNRKLTFGKVLLHGYTFGKRVDSLEKGLQDLFMAREGEGSDGPPVLEFVWGKRHFGPCVIQNIQVREKAWDKGILVNAEVSFELEQVPEWTINDGFVDVLRPGRQPTVNDPSLASENYRDNSTTRDSSEKEKANDDGGGGGQPSKNQYDPNLCRFATDSANNFYKIALYTDQWLRSPRIDPILPPSQDYIIEVRKFAADFLFAKDGFYKGSTLIGKYVDSKMRNYAPGCMSGGELYGVKAGSNNSQYYKVVKDLLDSGKYKSMVGFINGCVKNTEKHIKEWQADPKNLKCQPEREKTAELNETIKCQQFQLGRKCDSPGAQTSCSTVNGGKTVFCRRNPSKQGSAFVWSSK